MNFVATRDKVLYLLEGETLLEGLERTGHEVNFQCRDGFCDLCSVALIAGSVTYSKPPLALIPPGEILPCCCQVTESIIIDCSLREGLKDKSAMLSEHLFNSIE
ncbi:class I ribonucleotide reductase maintenance protein YfaE [Pantoea sp. 18069]|uniref:class I ribonucleotide reductase maintenance protein YfaE n=1 Tax=Pantoea sp. 18069 TaxID=2681415 RepID=UPI00135BB28D|nr:class I ribonucleotide reductase maintenance protein YfaE [Pantoea sp. 18069]